jgi:phosphatidylglycerophosphatase A
MYNSIKFKISYLISTFFGVGLVPVLPGTVASFVTAVITFFLPTHLILFNIFLIIFLLLIGVYCSGYLEKTLSVKDPSWIVIDEVLGMFMLACWFEKSWRVYLILFVLFRFFDIAKIYPIKKLETINAPGWGVMLDDVCAAVYAGILALVFFNL